MRPLTAAALIEVIESMGELAEGASLPKALLLFTTGAELADISPVLAAAQQETIAIHVVELLNNSADQSDALLALATESGGHYTALTTPEQSNVVLDALAGIHAVRRLQARTDTATPRSLTVAITLPDETTLTATAESAFDALTVAPLAIALTSPATERISWDSLDGDTAADSATRSLPIEASFSFPDGHERELLQVSYTLRGPAGFAKQEIRTAAPFDQAKIPLSDLEAGAYTLEIRALDELGLEAALTDSSFQFSDLPAPTQSAPVVDNPAADSTTSQDAEPAQSNETAAENNPAAADSAPLLTEPQANSEPPSDMVQLPGLQVALPRTWLIGILPVLLLLIGCLIYSERRERLRSRWDAEREDRSEPIATEPRNNSLYNLRNDQAAGNAGQQYALDSEPEHPTQRYALKADAAAVAHTGENAGDNRRTKASAPLVDNDEAQGVQQAVASRSPIASPSIFEEDLDFEEEITDRPASLEDEEATYRTQDVARAILGYLVRTISDPNLPKEVPIYNLSAGASDARQIFIGRHSQNNTIVINDKRISREHAVILQRDGRLYLRDNASTAGTFLNWKRLSPGEELLLRHNDLISFGQVAYEFHLHSEDEATEIND